MDLFAKIVTTSLHAYPSSWTSHLPLLIASALLNGDMVRCSHGYLRQGGTRRHKAAQSGTAAQRPAQRGIHSLPSKTDIPMKFTRLYHCHPLNQRCSITSSPSPSWGTKYYATSRLSSTRPPASTYRYAVVMIVIVGCRRY